MARKGLYANIHAKRKRGGKMERLHQLQPTLKSCTNCEEKVMEKKYQKQKKDLICYLKMFKNK
jgi:hypothetical protein